MLQMLTKGNYRKDCPTSAGTSPSLDQNMPVQFYSPPTTVTQTVTASYAVSQTGLVTIQKELAEVNQTN